MNTLLQLDNISKSFAGIRALRGVSFDLRAGEVHALVGENGAGKSTLIKIISGAHQPDAGRLEIAGQTITANDPVISRALGVAVIYQRPALLPDLTVAENIALSLEPQRTWRLIQWKIAEFARRVAAPRWREAIARRAGARPVDAGATIGRNCPRPGRECENSDSRRADRLIIRTRSSAAIASHPRFAFAGRRYHLHFAPVGRTPPDCRPG